MPLVVPPLLARPLHRVLVIGNAGGTTARALAAEYPGIDIDAVELDPVVTQLARQYMGMDSIPNLHVITADGREYLATTAQRYDLIVVDAYRTEYIPSTLPRRSFSRSCMPISTLVAASRSTSSAFPATINWSMRSRARSRRSSRRCGCGRPCTSTNWWLD